MSSPAVSLVRTWVTRAGIAVVFAAALAMPLRVRAVEPFSSWSSLTTGNGYGFAVYDVGRARLSWLTERPYYARDATRRTRDLAYDAYFGIRASGGAGWLSDVAVDSARYAGQSHVIEVDQRFGPIRARTHVLAPWGLDAPAVVLALRVTNASSVPQPNAAAYALLNFHLGGGAPDPGNAGESVRWDGDAYVETGPSGLSLRYVPLVAPSFRGASPENPHPTGRLGGNLVAVDDSGVRDDAVAGYQWELDDLAPFETRWVGVLVTLAPSDAATAWIAGRGPEAIVLDELAAWESWRVAPPADLSDAERLVWRQSESVLRMGQVREEGRGHGAILAALPPGVWWIAWVRDMSYATAALARMGHAAEAAAAVAFFDGA
ncbi:MAG: hypothetical protein IT379_11995, partial [Deltaproteobacteria bacterium]|nr:hypothetical protein [Deltaproteobacteria bacterium]